MARQVCQQVFEEAAVDLGNGLTAWSDRDPVSAKANGSGSPVSRRRPVHPSFRLPNKHPKNKPAAIRVGEDNRARSITLPGIGQIGVHDDTRRLRRMLAKNRAKICFADYQPPWGRWWVALNVEAADRATPPPTPGPRHPMTRMAGSVSTGVVGVFGRRRCGGEELARIADAPKALARPQPSNSGWRNRCHARRKMTCDGDPLS